MRKNYGFTIIELLVTILISAILAIITVPSVQRWYHKDQFIQQSRDIIDAIYEARTSALTDKKCSNGNPSVHWIFEMTSSKFSLTCSDGSDTWVDDTHLNAYTTSNLIHIDGASGTFTSQEIKIKFISGRGTPKIYLNTDDFSLKKAGFTLEFSDNPSLKRTICFNRISDFPTISSTATCNE